MVWGLIGLLATMGLFTTAMACVPSSSSSTTAAPQPVEIAQLQGSFVCSGGGGGRVITFRLTIGPDRTYRREGIGRREGPETLIPASTSSDCEAGSAVFNAGKLVLSGGLPCDYDGVACLTTSTTTLAIERADARGFATKELSCERR